MKLITWNRLLGLLFQLMKSSMTVFHYYLKAKKDFIAVLVLNRFMILNIFHFLYNGITNGSVLIALLLLCFTLSSKSKAFTLVHQLFNDALPKNKYFVFVIWLDYILESKHDVLCLMETNDPVGLGSAMFCRRGTSGFYKSTNS